MSTIANAGGMHIVTTDPSGNYRFWHGAGTGIGKDSYLIKKHLQEIVDVMDNDDDDVDLGLSPYSVKDWSGGLEVCLKALLETVRESQNMKETPTEEILEELDGLVIFDMNKKKKTNDDDDYHHCRDYSCCAAISRDAIQTSFRKVLSLVKIET